MSNRSPVLVCIIPHLAKFWVALYFPALCGRTL